MVEILGGIIVIVNNPCKYIKKPQKKRIDLKPFNKSEIDLIIDHAENYNFKMYLYIAFYTGLRSGEIIGLKKEDIDFEKNVLYVRRTRGRFGNTSPKTQAGFRAVPILDDLRIHLQELYKKHDLEYLLVTKFNEPYKHNNTFVNKQWIPLLKELEIPYRRLYNTRHTYATMMLTKGYTTPHNLAKILGHRDSQMVHDVYARFVHDNKFDFDMDIKLY